MLGTPQPRRSPPSESRISSSPSSPLKRSAPAVRSSGRADLPTGTLTTQIPARFISSTSVTGVPAPSAFTARLATRKELDFTQASYLRRFGTGLPGRPANRPRAEKRHWSQFASWMARALMAFSLSRICAAFSNSKFSRCFLHLLFEFFEQSVLADPELSSSSGLSGSTGTVT